VWAFEQEEVALFDLQEVAALQRMNHSVCSIFDKDVTEIISAQWQKTGTVLIKYNEIICSSIQKAHNRWFPQLIILVIILNSSSLNFKYDYVINIYLYGLITHHQPLVTVCSTICRIHDLQSCISKFKFVFPFHKIIWWLVARESLVVEFEQKVAKFVFELIRKNKILAFME